jgi:hypothetical protein
MMLNDTDGNPNRKGGDSITFRQGGRNKKAPGPESTRGLSERRS